MVKKGSRHQSIIQNKERNVMMDENNTIKKNSCKIITQYLLIIQSVNINQKQFKM